MNNECRYVFQFRGCIRNELCSILDLNDKWKELAAWLGYSVKDVEQIVRTAKNRSPSDVLLEQWGQKAPTMHMLFVALYEIQHYQALMLLKDFVPEEFHTLIYEGEENLDTMDNVDGAEGECFSSSDSNNIVNHKHNATKQLNSKLIDLNKASTISSTCNKEETCQPSATNTGYDEIPITGHQSSRFTLLKQQEDLGFPPNVTDPEVNVNGMTHSMRVQEDVASFNQSYTHTISAPPARFVSPEVPNAPTSNTLAFSGYASVSPWCNSESCCKNIVPQVECSRITTSAPDPSGLEKTIALPESTYSADGMLSSAVNTAYSSSGPARRVGSSLASKKLTLGAL